MGCYCPDKLMSLKQQARLRSLRARAENNLQEKWQEKLSRLQRLSNKARLETGDCFSNAIRSVHMNRGHRTQTSHTNGNYWDTWNTASHAGLVWDQKWSSGSAHMWTEATSLVSSTGGTKWFAHNPKGGAQKHHYSSTLE